MNDKIKEYKEKMNWNVWLDITSTGNYVIPEKDKIIKVNTKTVKCDNDHPAVWYSLTETGFAVCGYCNIKYVWVTIEESETLYVDDLGKRVIWPYYCGS